jgi:hypothetical protein
MSSFENGDNFVGKENNMDRIEDRSISKGKGAIDILHDNIVKEKEKALNLKISDMYSVDYEEASEIHINYHLLRIYSMIEKSDTLSRMKAFIESNLDVRSLAAQVAFGQITENTCMDILIGIMKNQKETKVKDRYINFYG